MSLIVARGLTKTFQSRVEEPGLTGSALTWSTLGLQLVWAALLIAFARALFARGVERLDVQGG